jgi:hypothetical protein
VIKFLDVDAVDIVFCSSLTIDSEPGTWNMLPNALECVLQETVQQRRMSNEIIVVNLCGQIQQLKVIKIL